MFMQMLKKNVSTNQIALALGIPQFQLNRIAQRIGLPTCSTSPGRARELDFQQALALALIARTSKHTEWPINTKTSYPFILSEVKRLGSYVDEYVIVINQISKEFSFEKRKEALAAMEEASGNYGIIEVRPSCLKLAGLFGKALTEEIREMVIVK